MPLMLLPGCKWRVPKSLLLIRGYCSSAQESSRVYSAGAGEWSTSQTLETLMSTLQVADPHKLEEELKPRPEGTVLLNN